jgi:regulator of sigma E protease
LQLSVTLYGAEHDMELLIRRQDGRQPQWVTIRPTDRLREYGQPAALGVRPAFTTKLSPQESSDASVKQEAGHKDFRGGDEIVAVNGQVLPRDKATGAILEYHLERVFASHMKEPVTVTVRRSGTGVDEQKSAANAPQEVQVTLPPQRMRTIGLIMEIGPLVAVRKNSPAEKAGCQVGDVLVSVAGEDVRDPFTLAERLLPRIGKELEFQVRRQGELVTLRATPVPPETAGDSASPGIPLALESLGLAFDVKSVVQAVESDLPASKAGLRTGDEILEVQFLRKGKKSGPPIPMVKRNEPGLIGKFLDFVLRRESDYTEKPLANWVHVFAVMNAVPDATLELRYRRDGTESTASLSPVASETWYYGSRSVATTPLSLVRTAESWGEAWRLGVRETGSSLKNVVAVLQRLFTGGISVKSMGGPILIVAAAGSEASHGMARLLLFLTFLSANLAVLNFLPIPALDGGHIVFLAAEGLRGKPVNERLQVTLTLIGVVGLLSLMMLVFALDIQRFLLSG